MEIKLSFSEKPKSASKDQAVRIARQCGAVVGDGRYSVTFDEISAPFKKLLSICGPWRATELYLDDIEYSGQEFFTILNCNYRQGCDGICQINFQSQRYRYPFIIRSIRWAASESRRNRVGDTRDTEFDDFVRSVDDSSLVVEKQKLLEAVLEDSRIPLMVCDKCTVNRISEVIQALPDKISLTDESDTSNVRRWRTVIDFDDDESEDEGGDGALSQYDITRYTAIAEIMAPIIAREIAKELTKYLPTIEGSTDL